MAEKKNSIQGIPRYLSYQIMQRTSLGSFGGEIIVIGASGTGARFLTQSCLGWRGISNVLYSLRSKNIRTEPENFCEKYRHKGNGIMVDEDNLDIPSYKFLPMQL